MEFYKREKERERESLMEKKSRVNQTFSDNTAVSSHESCLLSSRLILQHPHRIRDLLGLEDW